MSKSYMDLNFTDDFMFCKILENNPELCKKILELILKIEIKKIICTSKQKSIEITSDGRGIRLDVFVEDEHNTVYDIEMQTTHSKDLPKRSRYYQGMIDLNLIERGARYRELKKSFVVFICLEDPFHKGLPIYSFTNRCKEISDLELGDDTMKVFVNAKGVRDGLPDDMKSFLDYLASNKVSNNEFIIRLDSAVENARKHEEWRLEYMTLLMKEQEKFDEGMQKGLEQGIGQGVEALVKVLRKLEHSEEDIVKAIMENFTFSEEEARTYL